MNILGMGKGKYDTAMNNIHTDKTSWETKTSTPRNHTGNMKTISLFQRIEGTDNAKKLSMTRQSGQYAEAGISNKCT